MYYWLCLVNRTAGMGYSGDYLQSCYLLLWALGTVVLQRLSLWRLLLGLAGCAAPCSVVQSYH